MNKALFTAITCLALPAVTTQAAVILNYEADQSSYIAAQGETIDVDVYLRETLTEGSESIIVNAGDSSVSGLFSGAVRAERTSIGADHAGFTTGTTANAFFDGTVMTANAPDGSWADLYGDSNSGFGPGLEPVAGVIHIGTFQVTASSLPNVTTTFSLSDYNPFPSSIEVLTYEFDELDGLIADGSFSVTSLPEPAGLAGVALGAAALLRRRRGSV